MSDDARPPARQVRDEFLEVYLADMRRGGIRALHAYQSLFPGHEDEVAEEYRCLEPGGETAVDPASPCTRGGAPGFDRIGPYRIHGELGRGGQALVLRAEHVELGRQVALKIMHTAALGLGSLAATQRFKREAEVTARLDHPAICTVYEAGEENGLAYIAMRLVHGSTLAELLARAREAPPESGAVVLPADEASGAFTETDAILRVVHLVEKCARGLHFAHEHGCVHRDVKPGNIMVTESGEPVLVDFGLARALESADQALTQSGDLMGTPYYMSPEQLTTTSGHAPIDPRSDVWALGVTLYECLTLRRAFEAPTREALFRQIAAAEPARPRTHNARIPRDLEVVLETAIEKSLGRRYQSALDLAEDLRRVRTHEPIRARPSGAWLRARRWTQRHPVLATTFLLVAASLVVALVLLDVALGERALAQRALADYQRMADPNLLQGLIAEARDDLWPAKPAMAGRMAEWLRRAGELEARKPLHEAALAAMRRRARRVDAAAATAGAEPQWRFDDQQAQWQHDVLARHLQSLALLPAVVGEVAARKQFAEQVERRSILEPRDAWDRAIAQVRAATIYGGLELRPQLGLVPLQADPQTGLWEFTHLESGAPPSIGAEGHLAISEGTGLVLVLLPGGSFLMGAQSKDPGQPNHQPFAQPDEAPVQRVTLEPFFVSKYEMTQAQWQRCAGTNPSIYAPGAPHPAEQPFTLVHPVENVSFDDCRRYLARWELRLPTEAQWEYAARGGTTSAWWTGDDVKSLAGAANLFDSYFREHGGPKGQIYEDWLDDGQALHAPVGSYRPNAFGLFDTAGNVWEWCLDVFAGYAAPPRNGDGLREADTPLHVYRGGSWFSTARDARSSNRQRSRPEQRTGNIGVRPVRPIER